MEQDSDEELLYKGNLIELCKYSSLRINLLITTVFLIVLTMGYAELNLLLKYLKGDMFINAYTLASGEIIAKLSGGLILSFTGLKGLHNLSYGFLSLGALLMVIFYQVGAATPYLVFFTRFGIGMGWLAVYFNFVFLFPTVLKSSSAGIATFFGKLTGIIVPFIAEMEPPWNISVLLIVSVVAFSLSFCLKIPKARKEI